MNADENIDSVFNFDNYTFCTTDTNATVDLSLSVSESILEAKSKKEKILVTLKTLTVIQQHTFGTIIAQGEIHVRYDTGEGV